MAEDGGLHGGAHTRGLRLELLGRVMEGGPRHEDGGRLPGPELAAMVERLGGAEERVRCRNLVRRRGRF